MQDAAAAADADQTFWLFVSCTMFHLDVAVSGALGMQRWCFDLFWTWFAYSNWPRSRLLHDLAVAELSIFTICCNFDQFDADPHLFTIRSCIALFAAVSSQRQHLHFWCSALSVAVDFTGSDFVVEQ